MGTDDVRSGSGLGAGSTARVPHGKQGTEHEREQPGAELWPIAADGGSGMRQRRDQEQLLGTLHTEPYQLLSHVGTTAYGRAYRAVHTLHGRDACVHVARFEDDPDGTFASALPLAVAKCAQLSHPNVVALEAHGRDEAASAYFLVTEPLLGVGLAEALAEHGALSLGRALGIALQVGRALRAAHKLGIAHGALSPANVRLVQVEGGELVRVVGFGWAGLSPPSQRALRLSAHPSYVAPELAGGALPEPASDVFALGELLYHMLTGQPSGAAEGRQPAPLSSADGVVPRELEELVLRCIAPQPSERFSDVVSVMRGLREIARGFGSELAGASGSLTLSATSLPPSELPPAENDNSGSLYGADARRSGAAWIAAGLLLALAAVWLLWAASARVRPDVPPLRTVPASSRP